MKTTNKTMTFIRTAAFVMGMGLIFSHCDQQPSDMKIYQMDPAKAAAMTKTIETTVTPQIAEGLTLKLWAMDSLVADPVSIDVDDQGRIYYTRTNRQKSSEFDIRGHEDWEIESIQLTSIEEKRAFLHKTLSPENSSKNLWLRDVNGDSSHDWRDMTVEKEHIYRVEDTNGDGIADKSQLVVEDFNDETTDAAGGVLKHGDDLFVAIGPDLWKIKENKWGLASSKESLSHGYGIHIGFSGHGMSGIEVGPEGKIYWQIGDIGFNGVDKNGKKWSHPNSGVICRANPDGSDFEVFSYGNRNTHEFVFDEYGNLISEDNDGDHPGESERIVYVVNGADIGWRTNWQFGKYRDPDNNTYKVWMDEKMYVPRWEGQAAYILPTIKNFVNGPTGMLFNPGTAMGEEYKNNFFVVEFVGNPSRSGIHAFKLKPKGASFDFDGSKSLVSGVLATGIDWGPDGSMYVGDWIEGWGTKNYGRIWKLDVNKPNVEQRKNTEMHIRADFKNYKDEQLKDLLKHADMRVRQKVQFELANRGKNGLDIFKSTLANKEHQLARVHSIWGISQFARKNLSDAAILVPYLKDADPEIRAQAAKWIGDVRYKDAGAQLIPLLKDSYSRSRFFAAEALGRIEHAAAINPIIEMLAANNDEDNYLRHAGSLALARIGKAEPVIALAKNPSRAVRIAAVVALRRMQNPGIKAFLNDSDEFVVTEAARAINDDLSIPEALPDLANALNDSRFSNEAFVRRAINANLRVGTDKNLQNLISYANKPTSPSTLRAEAIDALSTWAKPSVLDRVDGRFRGNIKRDIAPAQKNTSAPLIGLLKDTDSTIRIHSIKALGKLKIAEGAASVFALLKSDPITSVRVQAIQTLSQLSAPQMNDAIKIALTDKEKSVRVVGLELLKGLNIEKDVMVSLLNDVINTKTVEEKQTAITTLGSLPLASTEKVFSGLLDQMQSHKLPVEVTFELSDAIDSTGSANLKSRFLSLNKTSSPDSLKAAYAGAVVGGDPKRGANIFWSHPTAQCLRCHSFSDYGGTAGPKLNGVANRLKREQMVEALIEPSARIAPGYGIVTLELKNKNKINGILQAEKPDGYLMKIGDKPDTLIRKTDVLSRINNPSSMPQMNYLLSKKEIRDVVSFLATLKED
ncbi:MAG: HEAT repeat domain-containing protein [Chitinophagaceae bacterium]